MSTASPTDTAVPETNETNVPACVICGETITKTTNLGTAPSGNRYHVECLMREAGQPTAERAEKAKAAKKEEENDEENTKRSHHKQPA